MGAQKRFLWIVVAFMAMNSWVGGIPTRLPSRVAASFTPLSISLDGGVIEFSSPTLADLDGNGRPEVLVGSTRHNGQTGAYDRPGVIAAVQGDGGILWQRNLGGPINSAPAVGDLDSDGVPEVVVTVGGDVNDPVGGGLVVLDRNGNVRWRFQTQEGIFSSPTLCDVNQDGQMEIFFGGWDQRIYLLDAQGRSLWNNLPNGFPGSGYYNADSIWSTGACADLNRDGELELIIGADITGGGVLPDGTHTQDGGFLYIFDRRGNVLVRRYLPEAIYAAPAVGDLDGDGDMEIVSGTGWYWWNAHGRTETPYVYVFNTGRVFNYSLPYSDPAKLPYAPGWPQQTDYPGFSSPALADLDKDNDLEIIIGTSHPNLNNDGILGTGSIYAWHHTGALVSGWPIHPKNAQGNDGPIFCSPTVADADADGALEVLFSTLWDVQIYSAGGALESRLGTYWTVWGSPAVGDTDGDGNLEIWVGGSKHPNVGGDPSRGYLWKFETVGNGPLPWPMFHRDPQHTGRYPSPPRLNVSPASVYILHQYGSGDQERAFLRLRNIGEGSFSWTVSSQPSGVTVSPSSGTLPYTSTALVTITVMTTGYQTGTYSFGNIVFTAPGAQGSPTAVPVTLYVGQVYRAYLPLVLRNGP